MKLYISVILTALLLSLTACRGEGEPVLPETDDNITLSFRMSTGIASRTDDQNHAETDSEYPWFEDRIDAQDLAVFIFIKKADSDKETLLFNTKAPHESIDFFIDGAPGQYVVNMNVSRAYLAEILDTQITQSSTEELEFRVVLFANCSKQSTDGSYDTPWTTIATEPIKSYQDLINALKDEGWYYNMSWLYNANPADNDITSIYDGRPIPMFGTKEFKSTQQRLYNSSPENPLFLGSIDLLRAVAKVRIVDNIEDKGTDGYPKIVSAEIRGTQDKAYQLPYNALTYVNGNQVHTPNIVDADANELVDPIIQLGRLPNSWTMTPASERKGDTFAGFIPEQKIGNINNTIDQSAPIITIRVAMRNTISGSELIRTYTVNMDNFKDFGNSILRNHIYTLSVTGFNSNTINCEVDLVPYRGCVLDPWFGLDPEQN